MYSQPLFTEFGYLKDESDSYRYKLEENMEKGRYCDSGIAAIVDENTMMCVEIDSVTTNIDSYAENQEKPAKCQLILDQDDACKYYYKDKAGELNIVNTEFCECSLMEPIPASGALTGPRVDLPFNKTPIAKEYI